MRFAAVILTALVCTPALASDIGSPIDVNDWVIADPSLHVETWVPRTTCDNPNTVSPPKCHFGFFFHWDDNNLTDNVGSVVDAAGNYWMLVQEGECSPSDIVERLYRCDPASDCEPVAWIPRSRCADGAEFRPLGMWVDSVNGYLYVAASTGVWSRVPYALEVHRFSGLTTTFEVMQTFAPQPNAISFRVPYMPEGMRGVDRFDTYYGSLAHPIDFSAAQPLACGYPSSPPHVGDYLSVADPLPDPSPGTGRYYITATTYQGQTRYGRKATTGVLSGRYPALLPACVAPASKN